MSAAHRLRSLASPHCPLCAGRHRAEYKPGRCHRVGPSRISKYTCLPWSAHARLFSTANGPAWHSAPLGPGISAAICAAPPRTRYLWPLAWISVSFGVRLRRLKRRPWDHRKAADAGRALGLGPSGRLRRSACVGRVGTRLTAFRHGVAPISGTAGGTEHYPETPSRHHSAALAAASRWASRSG